MRSRPQRQVRDWALAFGPQDLVGRPEAAMFAGLSILALVLVAAVDVAGHRHATVGAIGFIPVAAAGWFLSARLTLLVAAVGVVLRGLTVEVGAVDLLTAGAQIGAIPLFAVMARTAAVSVIRARRSEVVADEVRASRLEMAELEKAKAQFLRLASHELRGPVGVLGGYLSLLDGGDLGELPPAAREVMPILKAKVREVNVMMDQMLETARMDDSRLQLRKAPADLGALLEEAVDSVKVLAAQTHAFNFQRPGDEVRVVVDRSRILTILTNLVDNAVKYSPEGGEVHCRIRREGGLVKVSVRDSGLGIHPAEMGRLFTRFGRIETDQNRHIGGTGLGLYLSRELARMHGGDLVAQSELGRGSTFTLQIPAPA